MTDNNKTNLIKIYGKDSTIKPKFFESLEQFNEFYTLHKSEIDAMTTNKLNRLYKINNYKITRRKIGDNENGVLSGAKEKTLCFQLIKSELTQSEENKFEELEQSLTELNSKIKSMELENNKIKQQLLEIIKVINPNS